MWRKDTRRRLDSIKRALKGIEIITRPELKNLIKTTLELRDTHSINSWVGALIAWSIIRYKEDEEYLTKSLCPTNKTVYEVIIKEGRELEECFDEQYRVYGKA